MFSYMLGVLISFSAAELVTTNYVRPAYGDNFDGELIYSMKDSWRFSTQKPIAERLHTHTPKTILIHHTGGPQKEKSIQTKLRQLYRFSVQDKPWGDVPYHFYIDKDGNMMGARPVQYAPDTNTEFNPNGYINIVVEGNYTREGGDKLTSTQKEILARLVADLKKQYKIKTVKLHKDVAKTECPGSIKAPATPHASNEDI